MEFRHLQVFMAIWQKGSFSHAAKAINLTQPTVSAHLKALEEEMGVTLFDRMGRAVTPTAAGRKFYGYCRQILRIRQELEREFKSLLDLSAGAIEIGGSNIPGQYILPRLIGLFKKTYPSVKVVLQIHDTAKTVALVASGALELGVVGALLEKKGLRFTPCFEDELAFIFPPGLTELAERDGIDVRQLASMRLIVREKGSGTRLATERALKKAGVDVKNLDIVAEMGSTEAIKQAVKAGVGCAILSLRAVRDEIAYGALKTIPVSGLDMKRDFYLVWHEKRSLSPTAARFRDFLLTKREC